MEKKKETTWVKVLTSKSLACVRKNTKADRMPHLRSGESNGLKEKPVKLPGLRWRGQCRPHGESGSMGEASTDTVKSVFEQESSGEGTEDPLEGEGPILVITSTEIKGAFLLTDCSEYRKYYLSLN